MVTWMTKDGLPLIVDGMAAACDEYCCDKCPDPATYQSICTIEFPTLFGTKILTTSRPTVPDRVTWIPRYMAGRLYLTYDEEFTSNACVGRCRTATTPDFSKELLKCIEPWYAPSDVCPPDYTHPGGYLGQKIVKYVGWIKRFFREIATDLRFVIHYRIDCETRVVERKFEFGYGYGQRLRSYFQGTKKTQYLVAESPCLVNQTDTVSFNNPSSCLPCEWVYSPGHTGTDFPGQLIEKDGEPNPFYNPDVPGYHEPDMWPNYQMQYYVPRPPCSCGDCSDIPPDDITEFFGTVASPKQHFGKWPGSRPITYQNYLDGWYKQPCGSGCGTFPYFLHASANECVTFDYEEWMHPFSSDGGMAFDTYGRIEYEEDWTVISDADIFGDIVFDPELRRWPGFTGILGCVDPGSFCFLTAGDDGSDCTKLVTMTLPLYNDWACWTCYVAACGVTVIETIKSRCWTVNPYTGDIVDGAVTPCGTNHTLKFHTKPTAESCTSGYY